MLNGVSFTSPTKIEDRNREEKFFFFFTIYVCSLNSFFFHFLDFPCSLDCIAMENYKKYVVENIYLIYLLTYVSHQM